MKKKTIILLISIGTIAVLFYFFFISDSPVNGTVDACQFDGSAFEVRSFLFWNNGFVVTDETEIIWDDGQPEDTPRTTFYSGIKVKVIPGDPCDPPDDSELDEPDAFSANKWRYAKSITFLPDAGQSQIATAAKPVIYLYPEVETAVTVKLNYDGQLTCTYPAYQDGWSVTAASDGTLTDAQGQTYNYLYWEGEGIEAFDFSQGFCVAGADTAVFLEDALAKLGLNRREANEFIVYWLPLMEANPYNLISFQQEAYTNHAELDISPAPDTLIRVFMAWKPLEEAVEIPAQELTAPERNGFTVIEWGGSQIE